jgi:signal transduction histidine kinase
VRSIRWRLTFAYAIALLATMVAFGAVLYYARQQTGMRALDQRLLLEAELSVRYLERSHGVLGRLVQPGEPPTIDPAIAAYFESIRDFLLLVDSTGQVLFSSDSASALSITAFERLRAPVIPPPDTMVSGVYDFSRAIGPSRYLVVPVKDPGLEVAAVLVAAPTTSALGEAQALLSSMFLIAPIIVGASVLLGYWVAGRNLAPLGVMVRELEAITDGRSLHRRVVVERTGDEVARLGTGINLMFERLERNFAALHRFTAEASHELKTPLMVLRTGVERALRNPATPPESLQALDESLMHIGHMSELVDSLLTLARADEGRLPLAVEDCDLRELVSEGEETGNILAEAKGLKVQASMPEVPVRLRVDRDRIRQLVLNLVTNAVKYTPEGGDVSLGLSDQGETVTLTVADTGIGIAAGDLGHIFDRFWRADPARSRVGESPGSGLGLAITKWIAEAHGGTISVQSRPGRGTLFTVTLPRSAAAPESAS